MQGWFATTSPFCHHLLRENKNLGNRDGAVVRPGESACPLANVAQIPAMADVACSLNVAIFNKLNSALVKTRSMYVVLARKPG